MNKHNIFISYSSADQELVRSLVEALERFGIRCWIAPRDVNPGEMWGDAIVNAISESKAVILVFSSKSNSSRSVSREIAIAFSRNIPIIPYRIENSSPSNELEYFLAAVEWFDGTGNDQERSFEKLLELLRQLLPNDIPSQNGNPDVVVAGSDKSKGYVFISYVRSDADFVHRLRNVFETKKYGYWDYIVGDRDFHGALYRELEERIDGAVAFMSIVSDDWRNSDWVASEFIYAKEAAIPIFVVQAKKLTRPLPILLNLQTRIDMASDFAKGTETLVQELSKKAL